VNIDRAEKLIGEVKTNINRQSLFGSSARNSGQAQTGAVQTMNINNDLEEQQMLQTTMQSAERSRSILRNVSWLKELQSFQA